jgi:hypothetical protein
MTEAIQISADKFLVDNYQDYGSYINFNRVIPGVDGLKPSLRRILMALHKVAGGSLTSTVNAIGATQVYHPFGDMSIFNTMTDMARVGAVDSFGDFGIKLIESVDASAPRYTKVGLSKSQDDYYFKLLNYTPQVEGEETMEPEFLLVPVPYSLIYGTMSWGLGINVRSPAFTYDSIVEAYRSDDPSKLVPQYGYKINRSQSDLEELWNRGTGRVALGYKVERLDSDTVLMIGSGEVFTPKLAAFGKWTEEGQIKVTNESDEKVIIRITRIKGARKVNMDEVYETAVRIGTNIRRYDIRIVHEGKIIRLGMKDWLDVTMTLFKQKYEQFKSDRVAKLEEEIRVLEILPEVGKLILAGKSNEEIADAVKASAEDVAKCMKKPVGMLRKGEFTAEIKSNEDKIKAIKAESAEDLITKGM